MDEAPWGLENKLFNKCNIVEKQVEATESSWY